MADDEMDRGEYEVCSYCGRSIFPDAPQCPYCGNYTDGQGPGQRPPDKDRRLPPYLVLVGWLVILAFLLPLILWMAARLAR
jgi:hypothetical protein